MNQKIYKILEESLRYDINSGKVFWKERPLKHFSCPASHKQFNKRFANKEAGTIEKRNNTKYRRINVSGKLFYAHTIAWILTYKEFPAMLDHIDKDGLNNNIKNLRLTNKSENAKNSSLSKRNKTGLTGVRYDKTYNVFIAQVSINRRHKQLYRGTLLDCAASIIAFRQEEENK